MALVRCEKCGKPEGRTRKYIRSVKPYGYPNTAAICGTVGCNNPGLVWLEAYEWKKYQAGERIFSLPTHGVKIKTM